jgi:uncharacterized membrane protein YhaH (DUF805 family)
MNPIEAVKSYFRNWKDFGGRACRSEYWWAILFTPVVFLLVFMLLGGLLGGSESILVGILGVITYVFGVIAGLSLVTRRLHDVNRSGWWYLIAFTGIGLLPLLYWLCEKGDEGDNRFGEMT